MYLILESVLKAYDRGVFDDENEELRCPMEREKVVIYLQILRPLYLQSLAFQSNNSTIADVIPGITIICVYIMFIFQNKQRVLFFRHSEYNFSARKDAFRSADTKRALFKASKID